jgi:hypothetical protein
MKATQLPESRGESKMCSVPNSPNSPIVSFSHSIWAFEPGELQKTVQHLESEGRKFTSGVYPCPNEFAQL